MVKNPKHLLTNNITKVHLAYDLGKSKPNLEQHNRIISILTFAMPSVAVIAITLMLLWPEIISQKERFAIGFNKNILEFDTNTLSIVHPHYISIDSHNRPIKFQADFAKETEPGSQVIEITKPKGSIVLASGSVAKMEANSGLFYRKQNMAVFTGNVRAFTDSNNVLTTENVNFDLNTKVLSTNSPVSGIFDGGTISSQGLITEDSGDIIKFTGKAKLTLTSKSNNANAKNKSSAAKSRTSAKNKTREK